MRRQFVTCGPPPYGGSARSGCGPRLLAMIETQPPGTDTAGPASREQETTAPGNTMLALARRVRRFRLSLPWNSEDDWERPAPDREGYRRDVIGVLIALLLSAVMLEFMRGFAFGDGDIGNPGSSTWCRHPSSLSWSSGADSP